MRKMFRNPLIEKRAQISLSLTLVQYLFFYTFLLLLAIIVPPILKFSYHDFSLQEQLKASREFLFLDRRVVPALLLFMLVESVHFLFITHRIFGPLSRFQRVLTEWGEGAWPGPFRRRKKDYHGDMFNSFNETTAVMGKDFLQVKDLVSSSQESMSVVSGGSPAETLKAVEEARGKNRRALEILSKYFPGGDGSEPGP